MEKMDGLWFCHNYGVNGETSSDILRRCWKIFSGHTDVKLATLLAGTNDMKIPIPPEIYRENIIQIVRAGQVHGMKVILGTLPPLKFCPFYPKENRDYIQKYSEEILNIAAENNLPVCDLSHLGEHVIDGVHFGHEGYVEMAKAWASIILNL